MAKTVEKLLQRLSHTPKGGARVASRLREEQLRRVVRSLGGASSTCVFEMSSSLPCSARWRDEIANGLLLAAGHDGLADDRVALARPERI